ncbi:MAG: ion channel [Alistipes sp.]|nr:ion channel [Alistipes sp.]
MASVDPSSSAATLSQLPPPIEPMMQAPPGRWVIQLLNGLVLLGSIVVIVALSFEALHSSQPEYYRVYMQVQFWVCIAFLLDFFVRFALNPRPGRFFCRNFIFLLVSIPYLHLIAYFDMEISHETGFLLRFIPLIRSGYGLAIAVGWLARSRATSMLISYLLMVLSLVYFSSLIFYMFEHPVNEGVSSYGAAIWWAFMNVTTVGAAVFAKTAIGQIFTVVLAASGMMLFPIFTIYITTVVEARKKREAEARAQAQAQAKKT